MQKRSFGKTGMSLTPLGYGAAEIGFGKVAQETVNTLLNAALDSGLNLIDTAECYLDSETLVGNAVAKRRKDFYLFTKCGHDGKSFGKADWDVSMLEQSIDRSLKKLQTDHVDLLQLHSCSLEMLQQGDVIAVVERAKKAGKTRFVGYSGDSTAAKFAIDTGRFDALQTSCNIFDQECIDLLLPAAAARGMGVIAKRPIGNVAWRYATLPENGYYHGYWHRMHNLAYDFLAPEEKGVEIALRFTLSNPAITTAIVGTTQPARWKSNAQLAQKGPLPKPQYDAIRARWKQIALSDWIGET
jgi:aryl-alcohol dehydrogenase-like predicted oxidoreductase